MKPMSKGLQRVAIFGGGALGIAIAIIVVLALSGPGEKEETQQVSRTNIVTSGKDVDKNITEQQRAMLRQVQEAEALKSHSQDKSYLGDLVLGEPRDVKKEEPEETTEQRPEPPKQERPAPPTTTQARRDKSMQDRQIKAQNEAMQAGLGRQLGIISNTLTVSPKGATVVNIQNDQNAKDGSNKGGDAGLGEDDLGQTMIVADTILAAITKMPVDTDRSTSMLAEIVGGEYSGALLSGKVIPLTMSGDVEDVAFSFTRMTFNGRSYRIDASALNENTALAALDGDVDRHIISRYVMPVIMAGLSGASTYFTARGTPATSVQSTGYGDSAIVAQDAANRQQAKDQGIGDAVGKVVDSGDKVINKAASRPNTVTLSANQSIGIIFNKAVTTADQIK